MASQFLRVLFLGDKGPHRPAERFAQLQPVLAQRQIEMVYTDDLLDLSSAKLAGYDALVIFANHTAIHRDQEQALLDFVDRGGGFVPLHSASFCFLNSPRYIELVGAQFMRHGAGTFQETHTDVEHPITRGLAPIESWDETYVHTKHNTNRIVLAERIENGEREPWTWVRTHGKGRVFYTAWGHDQRTWSNTGFHDLVERGIRWSAENSPTRVRPRGDVPPLVFEPSANPLPNYTPNAQWGTQGDLIQELQQPMSPDDSIKHVATLPGFEAHLFAAEPDVVNPIWLAWDERGRLWVAETVDYPNELQPEGQGRDRLKICEDTNGDGRADRFTVFADGLSVPTGFVFADGGVIVIHSGRTELFKDTTGDDRADVREVLFTGWNMNDTHATASNLRYGFDNWIWGVVGYSGFNGTVGGREVRFGQGIFRFKPDGSELEFLRSSNNNTWGLGFSEEGWVFGSTANGNASMYLPIPNRYYERVNGWSASRLESIADSQRFYPITDEVRQVDYHGRYTAGAGSALYTARQFPEEYWNRVQFVAEPTGHLLGKFHLEARGSDFVAFNGRNFTASTDAWYSPVAAEVGPDGAVWIADWYNYIIQHNPTPRGFSTGRGNAYETPLRDTQHGRIHRVTANIPSDSTAAGSSATARAGSENWPQLNVKEPATLVRHLRNDNLLWRMHAQRLLVERRQLDVVNALLNLILEPKLDALNLDPGALHALWTLDGLGAMKHPSTQDAVKPALIAALTHSAAAVRQGVVRVLPRTQWALEALLSHKLLEDAHPQVRLATALALSEMPSSDAAGQALFTMLNDPANHGDRWLPDAITSASARHDAGFIRSVLVGYSPEPVDADTDTAAAQSGNRILNPSFEALDSATQNPQGWRTVRHGGRATFSVADIGRTGSRSVLIESERGADASWAAVVPVRPRTDYVLRGWIKTEDLERRGNARGALFNVHELQDPVRGATPPVLGTQDWTEVQFAFHTGELTQITVNCLLGGWGQATGRAWFDDVELVPAPGAELAGEIGRVVRLVTTHYARRGPVDSIVATLGTLRDASQNVAGPILDGLVAGWSPDHIPVLGASDKAALTDVMNALEESVQDRLLALAIRWNQADLFGDRFQAIVTNLRALLTDENRPDEERVAAAKRFLGLDDRPESLRVVLQPVQLITSPALAIGLVQSLSESTRPEVATALTDHWTNLGPSARRVAVAALLRRPEWTGHLLDAVEQDIVDRGDLSADHWAQLRQHRNRGIARRATQLATATRVSADRETVVAELLPLAKEKGDAQRGEIVYAENCLSCHVFNGKGGAIGPDLTGVGSKDRADILLDILDPNRSVEANYRLWHVTTRGGDTFSGRMEAETRTTVEILDTTGQKHVVDRKDIVELIASNDSIMPSGFEMIPPADLTSLLEYLATAEAHP